MYLAAKATDVFFYFSATTRSVLQPGFLEKVFSPLCTHKLLVSPRFSPHPLKKRKAISTFVHFRIIASNARFSLPMHSVTFQHLLFIFLSTPFPPLPAPLEKKLFFTRKHFQPPRKRFLPSPAVSLSDRSYMKYVSTFRTLTKSSLPPLRGSCSSCQVLIHQLPFCSLFDRPDGRS